MSLSLAPLVPLVPLVPRRDNPLRDKACLVATRIATCEIPAPPNILRLRKAWRERESETRENGIVPFIIVVAIVVLLLLAATIVAAGIILCAQRGGVLDGVVSLNSWTVKILCHKLR